MLKPEADLDVHFRVGQELTLYTAVLYPDGVAHPMNPPLTPRIHLSGYEFVNNGRIFAKAECQSFLTQMSKFKTQIY
jgi:hypothetical protein